MNDPSWADGYVVDIDYTDGYYRELSPATLRFVALLAGVQAVDAAHGFNYCELGCGNGRSVVLHAAVEPDGRFFGVDFNPAHIHKARNLARDAGTGNATFLEKSFAELLDTDLPEMDFITMHGVHSWVNAENRAHIVEFIRQRLRPGGLVYVSYNCLPGLAPVLPLQRLLRSRASASGGALSGRIRDALDFAEKLDQAGADYFRANPVAKLRLASIVKEDPGYLAHEYFNANWVPAYHADVAAELAAAKVSYVGSATLVENFEQFALKPDIAKLLAGMGDRGSIETVKDFARNTVFRRDVFARGAPKANPRELEEKLGRERFCLARPRSLCHLGARVPAADLTLQDEMHAPVLDALARTPMTFDELAAAPGIAQPNRTQLRQAVFGLAAAGDILNALPAEGEAARRKAAARFNARALSRPSATSGHGNTLASPVLGCGMQMGFIDLLMIAAPRSESEAIAHALKGIAATGFRPASNGLVIDDPAGIRTLVESRARSFFGELLPYLRLTGIAD